MSDSRASYVEILKIDHGSSRQIQTAITFDSNVSAMSESTPALGETTTAIAFDHTFTYAYIHIFQ